MFHKEIHAKISELLRQRPDHGQYRLLDLGCGNARFLAPTLMNCLPGHYQGVDLAEAALEEARGYLAGLPSVVLTHGDLLNTLESTLSQWEVIFTGYAVHHLTLPHKASLFQAAGRCLTKGGWLVMVDVMRNENQSRERYLEEYLRFMRESWTLVPPDQLEEACAHVETHDFPESLTTLNELAQASGMGEGQIISQHGQHHALLFARDE